MKPSHRLFNREVFSVLSRATPFGSLGSLACRFEAWLIAIVAIGLLSLLRFGMQQLDPADIVVHSPSPIFRLTVTADDRELWVQRGISELVAVDLEKSRIRRITEWNRQPISSSSTARDGETYLLAINGNEIVVIRNGEILVTELMEGNSGLRAALSANGQTAVRIVNGSSLRVWDLATSDPYFRDFNLRTPAHQVGISPSGEKLAVSSDYSNLHVYDLNSGQLELVLKSEQPITADPVFSDDDETLAIAFGDRLEFHNLRTRERLWKTRMSDLSTIYRLGISSDGHTVAVGTAADGIRLIDTRFGQIRHQLDFITAAQKFAFSISSDRIYVGRPDGTIGVWSVESGRPLEELDPFDSRAAQPV